MNEDSSRAFMDALTASDDISAEEGYPNISAFGLL
jgi:hypothetical protein